MFGSQPRNNFGTMPFLGSRRGLFLRPILQISALHLLGNTLKYKSFFSVHVVIGVGLKVLNPSE